MRDFKELKSDERKREKRRVHAAINAWPREARHGQHGHWFVVKATRGEWLSVGSDWVPTTDWGRRCVEKGRMLKPPRPSGRAGK